MTLVKCELQVIVLMLLEQLPIREDLFALITAEVCKSSRCLVAQRLPEIETSFLIKDMYSLQCRQRAEGDREFHRVFMGMEPLVS